MHGISTNQWKQAVLPPSLIVFIQGRFIQCVAFCIGLWMYLYIILGQGSKFYPSQLPGLDCPQPNLWTERCTYKTFMRWPWVQIQRGNWKKGHHKWLSHSICSKVQLFACPEWMSEKQLIRWFVQCPWSRVETRLRDALIFLQASKLVLLFKTRDIDTIVLYWLILMK